MMIIKENIVVDLTIESLRDLPKLKLFMENSNIKINKAEIARQLDADVRIVGKYLNGYEKPLHRRRKCSVDAHKDIIEELFFANTAFLLYP